ncbi:class II aldolase/adducin family protein [Oceanicella actignis]|uniref:L-fuculose-phosphate aldolase n=1 Tax=Oceanicella actignis TaxID=1189325 RepID=A0A1M7S289_9RHOB|nr:class II aldolase/adducin family protein [Oceanicella actignis]SES90680.1 L-fuculose-phosphate aldolase [Oceanicella actignis]SHN52591.1 L-fuculose-phosphate aldolase [Oceanicella actignis]
MTDEERRLREEIIAMCLRFEASGLNQGTSGNVSARFEGRMIVTPSATPYAAMTAESLASTALEGPPAWQGPLPPSSEWRIHRDILRARPEIGAVAHLHPTYATAFAMCRMAIPAAHYMVAAFGGDDVRCADYAVFGGEALSQAALRALEGRTACLLANHGVIVLGETLAKAEWRAVELETLARQTWAAMQIGTPAVLSAAQMAEVRARFAGYGLRED